MSVCCKQSASRRERAAHVDSDVRSVYDGDVVLNVNGNVDCTINGSMRSVVSVSSKSRN